MTELRTLLWRGEDCAFCAGRENLVRDAESDDAEAFLAAWCSRCSGSGVPYRHLRSLLSKADAERGALCFWSSGLGSFFPVFPALERAVTAPSCPVPWSWNC